MESNEQPVESQVEQPKAGEEQAGDFDYVAWFKGQGRTPENEKRAKPLKPKDDKPDISPLEMRRGFQKPSVEDCYRLKWFAGHEKAFPRQPGDFIWDKDVWFFRWAYAKGVSATSMAACFLIPLSKINDILRLKARAGVGPGFPITIVEGLAGFKTAPGGPVELYKEYKLPENIQVAVRNFQIETRQALPGFKRENNIFED